MRQPSQSKAKLVGLLGLGLVAFLLPSTLGARTGAQLRLEEAGPASDTRKCWVFNHMNKSGGSSVKRLMMPWVAQANASFAIYDSDQWKGGSEYAQEYASADITITKGGYTEGLRAYGAQQDCTWFTMFRQ